MYDEYAQGPADAAQPRHPPPARAAARQRPRRDRADARDPVLAARQPGPLLRRRDRHGRQRLPRRPRRRPHADAVDGRPQRRLLARRLRAALPAAAHGPGLRLPGRQRRGAAPHADVAPPLDAAGSSRCGRSTPCSGSGRTSRCAADEPADLRARPPLRGRDVVLCVHNLARSAQPVELDLSAVRGARPGGDARRDALPADRRAAVPAHARAARLLLVPAEVRDEPVRPLDEAALVELRRATSAGSAPSRGSSSGANVARRGARCARSTRRSRRRARRAALRGRGPRPLPARSSAADEGSTTPIADGLAGARDRPRDPRAGRTSRPATATVEFARRCSGSPPRRELAGVPADRASSSRTRRVVVDDELIREGLPAARGRA